MRALSSLGIGLSLVSAFLLLALLAELYYLLWWKKRSPNGEIEEVEEEAHYKSPARELLYLFCWKKPSSLSSTALNPQEISAESNENHQHKDLLIPFGEEGMEAELMRLHSLSGPPRFLFTIKEETKEDLESEDGRSRGGRSSKSSRGRSLSDVLLAAETPPFLTPLSSPPFFTPPLTPNPLYESARNEDLHLRRTAAAAKASPPPKFKFLRDAEEKLYKRTLTEEAMRLHKMNVSDPVVADSPSRDKPEQDGDGSFITIIIGKNREKGNHHHHPSSSQVNPLPTHGNLGSYMSSSPS